MAYDEACNHGLQNSGKNFAFFEVQGEVLGYFGGIFVDIWGYVPLFYAIFPYFTLFYNSLRYFSPILRSFTWFFLYY